jgi:hypothetical protein
MPDRGIDSPTIDWCLPHRGLGREIDPVRGGATAAVLQAGQGQTGLPGSFQYFAWRVIRSCPMCVQYLQERPLPRWNAQHLLRRLSYVLVGGW